MGHRHSIRGGLVRPCWGNQMTTVYRDNVTTTLVVSAVGEAQSPVMTSAPRPTRLQFALRVVAFCCLMGMSITGLRDGPPQLFFAFPVIGALFLALEWYLGRRSRRRDIAN